jgi:hypothetical protein
MRLLQNTKSVIASPLRRTKQSRDFIDCLCEKKNIWENTSMYDTMSQPFDSPANRPARSGLTLSTVECVKYSNHLDFGDFNMKKFIKRQRLTLHILTAFVLFIALFLASCGNKDNRRGAYYNQNRAAQQRNNNFPRYQGPLGRPRGPGSGQGMDPLMTAMLEMQLKASANSKGFGKTALIAAGVGGAAGIGVGIIAAIAASGGKGQSSLPPLPPLGGCPGGGIGCSGGMGRGPGSIPIGSPCPQAQGTGRPGILIATGACMPPQGTSCDVNGARGRYDDHGGCSVTPVHPCDACDRSCPYKTDGACRMCDSLGVVYFGDGGYGGGGYGNPGGGGDVNIYLPPAPASAGRGGGGGDYPGGGGSVSDPDSIWYGTPALGATGDLKADRKYDRKVAEAKRDIVNAYAAQQRRAQTEPDNIKLAPSLRIKGRLNTVENDLYMLSKYAERHPELNNDDNFKNLKDALKSEKTDLTKVACSHNSDEKPWEWVTDQKIPCPS